MLLDLKAGFNLTLNEGFDLNDVDGAVNLDANGDADENSRK